jgi:hypothetical protein
MSSNFNHNDHKAAELHYEHHRVKGHRQHARDAGTKLGWNVGLVSGAVLAGVAGAPLAGLALGAAGVGALIGAIAGHNSVKD